MWFPGLEFERGPLFLQSLGSHLTAALPLTLSAHLGLDEVTLLKKLKVFVPVVVAIFRECTSASAQFSMVL